MLIRGPDVLYYVWKVSIMVQKYGNGISSTDLPLSTVPLFPNLDFRYINLKKTRFIMFHPHLSLLRSITSTPGVANTWWRHQMHGNICRVTGLCAGNSPVIGEFPHKGQWSGALMFSLISAWINSWVNNREAGDFRRHRAHYDVIVMRQPSSLWRRLSHGTKHQSLRATTTLKWPSFRRR